jgi:hypothetical protein
MLFALDFMRRQRQEMEIRILGKTMVQIDNLRRGVDAFLRRREYLDSKPAASTRLRVVLT